MSNSQRIHLMRTNPSTNARKTDPISSHIAGHIMEVSGKASGNRAIVLELVRTNPGLTSRELFEKTGVLDRHEIARRMSDLHDRKQVYISSRGFRNQRKWSAL